MVSKEKVLRCMMYRVGEHIVHPLHGAGVIDEIEERKVGDKLKQFYVLHLGKSSMTVKIPVESCDSIGVRPVVDSEYAERVISSFGDISTDMTQNWNKRYRENLLKIRSGDLFEVAGVIKGLMERESQKGLSNGERKMLRSAKQIFISELVIAQDSTYEEVETRLNEAFG
jgi:CarD family transcriptional regulator